MWRVCERFNIDPLKNDNNTAWQLAQLLAYENIRENEDAQNYSGI